MATKLEYLWVATFRDGSTYKQNKEDTSLKFPPVKDENGQWQGKNSWTDIKEDVENCNLASFSLIQNTRVFPKTYKVDLIDGHFEIDGTKFLVEDDSNVPYYQYPLKLIWRRITNVHQTTPAIYRNPLRIEKEGSSIIVTNSQGEVHTYPKVDRMWKEEKKEEVGGKEEEVKYLYVLPTPPESSVMYMLGWQTTIEGKNYQKKIIIY